MARLLKLTLLVVVTACAGPARLSETIGEGAIGGFVYQMPGEGWRGVRYPPSAEGLVRHDYKRDGDRWQFQLSQIRPARPVRDEAALAAWAAQAGGGRVELTSEHGATCASYAHRWRQTLSPGGEAQPWATIEERGLFCIDPQAPDTLLQVRVFERLEPEATASAEFDPLAIRLLAGFRARLDR